MGYYFQFLINFMAASFDLEMDVVIVRSLLAFRFCFVGSRLICQGCLMGRGFLWLVLSIRHPYMKSSLFGLMEWSVRPITYALSRQQRQCGGLWLIVLSG